MLTTTQVRNIMRQNGADAYGMYTNKTTGDRSDNRRVKCYYRGNAKLLAALRKAAGTENVTLTEGGTHFYAGGPGITVKCVLG